MLRDLSESRLFPSIRAFEHVPAARVAETLYLYLIALRILATDAPHHDWVVTYCRRTAAHSGFRRWRQDGNDLYALLHALVTQSVEFKDPEGSEKFLRAVAVDDVAVLRWLRNEAHEIKHEPQTRALLISLDRMLNVRDTSLRAVRRLATDWPRLEHHQRRMVFTRLIQLLRHRAQRADILPRLQDMAARRDLLIPDAADPEETPPKRMGFLSSLATESATAGATASSNVATVAGGLGAGFDGDHSRSIYGKPKKPILLRR